MPPQPFDVARACPLGRNVGHARLTERVQSPIVYRVYASVDEVLGIPIVERAHVVHVGRLHEHPYGRELARIHTTILQALDVAEDRFAASMTVTDGVLREVDLVRIRRGRTWCSGA